MRKREGSVMSKHNVSADVRLIKKGSLKAIADVIFLSDLGEVTVRGFRVIQKDGDRAWVGFPTTNYTKNGEVVNKQILDVSKTMKHKLTDLILAEYKHLTEGVPF